MYVRRNEDDWKQRQKEGAAIKEMGGAEFTACDNQSDVGRE